MKDLPYNTRKFLKDVTRNMPRAPYQGVKAISNFVRKNYLYGCDENIVQNSYSRYPDRIKKYMTCHEAGIMNFLLVKQLGLDAILIELENYNETKQSHFEVFVRGHQSNYTLGNREFEKIKHFGDGKLIDSDGTENTYKKLNLYDVSDIKDIVDSYDGKNGFEKFFGTGQYMSSYYDRSKKDYLFFKVQRFIKINQEGLKIRKSFELPGHFMHTFFQVGRKNLVFSSGINNSKLINPVNLGYITPNGNEFIHSKIDKKLKEKLFKTYVKSKSCCHQMTEDIVLEFTKDNLLHLIDNKLIDKQKKLYVLHYQLRRIYQDFPEERYEELKKPFEIIDVNNIAQLYNYEYYRVNSKENYNYYGIKQRNIMEKYLKPLCEKKHIQHNINV